MKIQYAYGKLGIRRQIERARIGPFWKSRPRMLPLDKIISGLFRINRTRKNSADIEIITDKRGVETLKRLNRGMKRWQRKSATDRAFFNSVFHPKRKARKLSR